MDTDNVELELGRSIERGKGACSLLADRDMGSDF